MSRLCASGGFRAARVTCGERLAGRRAVQAALPYRPNNRAELIPLQVDLLDRGLVARQLSDCEQQRVLVQLLAEAP
jgi:hypothetical protein